MRNLTLFLSIILFQFFGSKIGGLWFFIFAPFPLFFINKIISKKKRNKNVPYFLFPAALLSGELYIYFPAELARGMTPHEYFREFLGKITAALLLGALQWGIVKGLLLVEVLLGKYKKEL
jgi:hypothetical protein